MIDSDRAERIAEYAEWIREGHRLWHGDDWHKHPDIIAAYQRLADEALATAGSPPANVLGRGIVTVAGGAKYFTNAYVMVRMLRHLGSNLPVQLWHFPGEVDDCMRAIVQPWDVECIDVEAVVQEAFCRQRPVGHWELKAFAIAYCSFHEPLFVDADTVFVRPPDFLFEHPQYREPGVVLWPDYTLFPVEHPAWEVYGVEYREEPECQGGMMLFDKRRAWPAVKLSLHFNHHSNFYYRHTYGDKDTFRFACHCAGQSFAMPLRREHLPGTICFCDFDGKRLLQHRYGYKWRLNEPNPVVEGFWYEAECLHFLAELAEEWHGEPFLPR